MKTEWKAFKEEKTKKEEPEKKVQENEKEEAIFKA